ncbi:MAG: MATE family efflux transporter, partial [Bacillota bacterium]|nr:MATE family efflux transporter [Bacillota bacterium]
MDSFERQEEKIPSNKMGTMPIGKLLFAMALPPIVSMTVKACYNIIDSFFVAKLGEDALAGITLVFPVQMVLIALGAGTGVGVNSLIARRLGAQRFDDANKAATHGFLLSFFSWFLFAVFGLFFTRPFLAYFTDDPAILSFGIPYCTILCTGSLFLMVYLSLEKILQATGNMLYPFICTIVGVVIKTCLNPVLMFGLLGLPALGVAGAALATTIGDLVTMIMALFFFFGKKYDVKIGFRGFRPELGTLKSIYIVALPAILMQSIGSVVIGCMNKILVEYSAAAVSVLGVYFRLQSIIFMPCFGLTQGALPIFGYNFGARKKARLMKAFKRALLAACCMMGAGLLVFQLFPRELLILFNATDAMMELGVDAFRILSLCFLPAAFGIICSTMFQGTGHGFMSLIVSLMRQLVCVLPLAWLLASVAGLPWIFASFPLAEIIAVPASALFLVYLYRREIRPMP